jgi:hypothetical protein
MLERPDLPHIPFVTQADFREYVRVGEGLARLHRDYLQATPYPLRRQEAPGLPFSWLMDEKGCSRSPFPPSFYVLPSFPVPLTTKH